MKAGSTLRNCYRITLHFCPADFPTAASESLGNVKLEQARFLAVFENTFRVNDLGSVQKEFVNGKKTDIYFIAYGYLPTRG